MRVIKCTYLNFAVSVTFPVAGDQARVILNECPLKKVGLICDTLIQIWRIIPEEVSQLLWGLELFVI